MRGQKITTILYLNAKDIVEYHKRKYYQCIADICANHLVSFFRGFPVLQMHTSRSSSTAIFRKEEVLSKAES
jgi:hypothetical protein